MVKKVEESRRRGNIFLLLLCEINNIAPLHLPFEIHFALQEIPYFQVLDFEIWLYFQDSIYTVTLSTALQHKRKTFISTHTFVSYQ